MSVLKNVNEHESKTKINSKTMFVLKVPSLHCFKGQTHFGIKATLTTTIVKTNQDALRQDILTRDFNLTCLKGKYLKIEPFCQTFPLSA